MTFQTQANRPSSTKTSSPDGGLDLRECFARGEWFTKIFAQRELSTKACACWLQNNSCETHTKLRPDGLRCLPIFPAYSGNQGYCQTLEGEFLSLSLPGSLFKAALQPDPKARVLGSQPPPRSNGSDFSRGTGHESLALGSLFPETPYHSIAFSLARVKKKARLVGTMKSSSPRETEI